MSAENNIDTNIIPLSLSETTQIKKMLITRIHFYVKVQQIRGGQYRYSGHIINFRQNITKLYQTLSLLSQNLSIILLKLLNTNKKNRLQRQFVRQNKVRYYVIKVWLLYLKNNYSNYL